MMTAPKDRNGSADLTAKVVILNLLVHRQAPWQSKGEANPTNFS